MWHITDDDGLPSRTVYNTAQDQNGYIWIGTEKGLCRFDGQNFKTYKSEEFNDLEILKVAIDPLGRVWFRNLSGQLFYLENEIIHNAQTLFSGEKSGINDFIIDDHTIWIVFNDESDTFKLTRLSFDKKGVFTPLYVYEQIFDYLLGFRKSGNSIYIFSRFLDLKKNNYLLIQLDKESNSLDIKNRFVYEDRRRSLSYYVLKDKLYLPFHKNQEAYILQSSGNKLEKFLNFKKKTSLNHLQILDEQFWILTNEGLIIKSILSESLEEPVSLLKDKSTNHLMVDQEGNKWIATTGEGIYVITAPQTQVIQVSNFALPNNEIYSLGYNHAKKELIAGHSKGKISLIDPQLKISIIASNSSGRVVDLLVDHNDNYWCINETELIVFSPDLTVKKRFWGGVKTLLETNDQSLWIGSFQYTQRVSEQKIDSVNSQYPDRFVEKILSNRTYALYQDYSDKVWIGTVNGLYVYQDTVKSFLENENPIPYNISTITQSVDSVILVGTRGDGMIAIKNDQVIRRMKKEDGLASNTIKNIFSTDQHIWIATDNGINKINRQSNEIEWINTADGLPSNEINDIEIVNNTVWVATTKGLANFSVAAQHKNKIPPPIYISNIRIAEKDTTLQDSFLLSYDQNNIQINMVGLGYKGKGDISYQYRLSGLEKDWVQTRSTFARYPNLPPGHYNFEVFALNEDQVKSLEPARVYFDVRPPWWRTWSFMIFSFLLIGGGIAYLVTARIRRKQQEQHFLEHVKELKTKALRSQMNPHFIFNALNAIQRFLTTNDSKQAMNYLSNFGKLIRLVFEQSQLEKISLEEELDFLQLYLDLEKLRFMDAIDIHLEVSPALQDISDEVYLPPLLIQPIVENSFKHGFLYKKELGVLKIKFSKKDVFLICTIEDNGIGRKKAAALGQKSLKDRPSSGLKTSEERLKILEVNKNTANIEKSELTFIDLYDDDGNVKGTLVEIKIYCPDLEPVE